MGDLMVKAVSVAIFGVVLSSSWFFLPAGWENVSAFSRQVSELHCAKKEPCSVLLTTSGGERHFLVTRSDGEKTVSFSVTKDAQGGKPAVTVLRRYDGDEKLFESEIDSDDKILEWLDAAKSLDCDSSACDGCMEGGQFAFSRS